MKKSELLDHLEAIPGDPEVVFNDGDYDCDITTCEEIAGQIVLTDEDDEDDTDILGDDDTIIEGEIVQ
jgi:hypothetical protein